MIIALSVTVVLLVLWNVWLTFCHAAHDKFEHSAAGRLSDNEHSIRLMEHHYAGMLRADGNDVDRLAKLETQNQDRHREIRVLTDATRQSLNNLESAFAARFGVSVQDVLRQKRESAEQEQAYYAGKEQA